MSTCTSCGRSDGHAVWCEVSWIVKRGRDYFVASMFNQGSWTKKRADAFQFASEGSAQHVAKQYDGAKVVKS